MSVFSSDQYQTLCAMIAKGVTSMEVNGEKVTFRSLDEMMRIKREMEQGLGVSGGERRHYPAFRRG